MWKVFSPLCIILFLITGCDQIQKRNTAAGNAGLPTQYSAYLTTLDTADIASITLAATEYRKLFFNAPKDSCDAALVAFERYCRQLAIHINDRLQDTATYAPMVAVDEWGIPKELTGPLQEFRTRLQENGYKVIADSGRPAVRQDWDFILARFSRFVSPEMKAYIDRLRQEDKETYPRSARVAVAPDQMVDRITWREAFSGKNAGFVWLNEVKEEQRSLLTGLMVSTDSTWFQTACIYLSAHYPTTITHKIISPYYKARVLHDSIMASALLDRYFKQGYILQYR